MGKRVDFRLLLVCFLISLCVLSACSEQGAIATTLLAPTDPPAPTDTEVPTDEPGPTATAEQPEPTEEPEPTIMPEPTETQPTKVLFPRLDVERPDISMELPEGDPERGAKLALARVCITCHVNSEGPPRLGADGDLPAILERAALRIEDPAYTGAATTSDEYLLESITDPRIYEVEGDWPESMDDNYYDLPEQDLADLIAWMLTLK